MSMSYGDYSYSGFFASSSLFTKGIQGVGCDVQHVGSSSEEEEMSMYGSNNNNMNASKKRRLSMQQVKCLETCFEEESKLEPERKIQLASDLGLQPRQVAVWFQNRRARWKTKQLERDYDHLKHNYDTLLSEKNQLQVQLARLSEEVRKLKGQENQSPSNSDSLEREKAETDANGSRKTATTTSDDGDEFHSLSPSFCSDANSALQRNNCKSGSTLPLSMEEEEPCLCSNTNFQPHLDVLDYLIIQESEPDWLGGFHLCH